MTDPAVTAGPASTSWRRVNLALIVLALLLVAASIFLFVRASDSPSDSRAETLSRQQEQVTKAATEQTEAFLTVDHEDMDPLIEKVLAGSTGEFKQQYEAAKGNLKAQAQRSEATSSGKVVSVGVTDIDDSDAVVFVAADSKVANKSTKGEAQPRYYRLKLTMSREGGRWRTSSLQFVA